METDPLDDPELPALVSAAMEMRDHGLEPPLEEICCNRPDLIDAVAASIETSERLPLLQTATASHDRFVGRVLDARYRLTARLGAGAMGVVYRGEDLELQRPVAVKILRAALLDEGQAESRFAREAEVLAAIDHAAVVTIYDRGRTGDDDPYLVMELLEGQPLSQLLEEGKRAGATTHSHDTGWIARALGGPESVDEPSYLRTVVRWTADLASGLGAAHSKGIFHRDIKPSNVFVRRDGRPVLVDFGIAARMSHATITHEHSTLGTPAYMAPEALDERSRPDAALDVYGLSATLYHMLTLRPPYTGTPSQIISRLAVKEPPRAKRLREGLPRDLQAILDRGMARRPSDRYASAAELEIDLRAFLDYRPVQARPLSPLGRAWRRARRSPAFWTFASVTALAVVAFFGVQARTAWLERRAREHAELWRHVPPNLTIVKPANRVLSDEEGRAEVAALLDQAAAVCLDPLPTLLIRAAFRLDHGDARGAADDMRRIAASVDTPYAQALADRYRALADRYQALAPARDTVSAGSDAARAPAAASAPMVDTSDLPEPSGRADVYLAAYHAMRAERFDLAQPLLDDPAVEEYAPAQELRALFDARDPHRMYERGLWLEEQLGGRTAMTAHLIGLALVLQKGQESQALAAEVIAEGLELVPRSHALRLNAGLAAWRLGHLDEAREQYRRAIELKPQHDLAYENLTRVLMDAGALGKAQAVVDSAPFDQYRRLVLEGEIEEERAIQHWQADDMERCSEAALRSVAKFDEAAEHGEPVRSARAAISRALVTEDTADVFSGLAQLLRSDPLKWRRLAILLQFMPTELNDTDARALRDYLDALHDVLAGDRATSHPNDAPR